MGKKHRRVKWGPIIGVVLLVALCLGSIAMADSTGKSGGAPGQLKKSPFEIERAELERLEKQGHSLEDIYTALDLQAKTGLPLAKWLAERKAGKTWPQAIEKLAKGIQLKKRALSHDGREMTEKEIYALLKEGYPSEDVMTAVGLVYDYGSNPKTLLDRRLAGESWESVSRDLDTNWRESQAKKGDGFLLGEDGKAETTATGLHKKEISILLEQGYTVGDILRADAVADALGVDFRAVAAQKPIGKTLYQAVLDMDASRTPEEKVQARKNQQSKGEVRVKLEGGVSPSGLTESEVNALVSRGHNPEEVLAADALAKSLGLEFRKIAGNKRPEQSWLDAVRQADKERTVTKDTLPGQQPTEEMLLKHYSRALEKTEAELKAARSSGKSWQDITGQPVMSREEHALNQAKTWGLTEEALVLQALKQGLEAFDAYQAALLSKNSKMSAGEILKLKTTTNTWVDVLKILLPGAKIPTAPDAPPPGTEQKPLQLKQGRGQ
ncbi:MAG: hypothetical protein Q8S19_07295 [Bacillota bacterium]|nr:hypothetical protein [Bacillota bacterium]